MREILMECAQARILKILPSSQTNDKGFAGKERRGQKNPGGTISAPGSPVPERKPSFPPISASGSNFNPQNTPGIPAVKIFTVLDLNEKSWFSFGHYSILPPFSGGTFYYFLSSSTSS